jgi:dynein heavy chain, axonemal
LDIREAKLQNKARFLFNNCDMALVQTCGVFVTMNPGYAGRTELPDNLKVLFRPVSMMIPNYGLIAEIMLFAEGFENAKTLSTKMV